jgi:hypothetical protein
MLWYASRQKLEALSAESGAWWDRLSGAKVGFWPASVEVGVQPGGTPKLERAVRRLNKRLREENAVVHVTDLAHRGPARFFEYEGPSVRNVTHGAFFVAAICNPVAIVLVGSAVNAVGAPTTQDVLIGSSDPIGAVRHLFDVHGDHAAIHELEDAGDALGGDDPGAPLIELAWNKLFSTIDFAVQSLPHTRGIALYAGIQDMRLPAPESSRVGRIDQVVLGSPVWVEQVEA